MKARCNSRPIWLGACAALTAALLLTAAQPATAQPGGVLSHQKISDTEGGFTGILEMANQFGYSVAALGDLDVDGVGDLAVGAQLDHDGGIIRGAVWVLFLNADGTVKSHQKISDTQGGFTGTLDDADYFGTSLTSLGDLDGDAVSDLAVGTRGDDDGGIDRGALWVLFLNSNGTVKEYRKISDTQGGFTGMLDNEDFFGTSVASLGDLDGDGVGDLAVGAHGDDDGGTIRGAVWVLFLDGVPCDPCDMNCDGEVNRFDIGPFLDLLFDPNATPCNTCTGDANGDGEINAFDIESFLECLFGP
jgi:hypothetical protein